MKWTRPQNRDKSYLHYHCTEPPLNNEKTREVSTVQCSIFVEFSEVVQLIVDCRQHFYLCGKKPQIRYTGLCWRPISRRISFVIWYEDLDLTADLGRTEWACRMYKSSLHTAYLGSCDIWVLPLHPPFLIPLIMSSVSLRRSRPANLLSWECQTNSFYHHKRPQNWTIKDRSGHSERLLSLSSSMKIGINQTFLKTL